MSHLFGEFLARSWACGTDTDRVASQILGGFHPFFMVIDGFEAIFFFCSSQMAFAIAHDEDVADSLVFGAGFKVFEVSFIFGVILKKGIYILDGVNVKIVLGVFGEIEVA